MVFSALGLCTPFTEESNKPGSELESDSDIQKSISVDRSFSPIEDSSILKEKCLEILKKLILNIYSRIPSDVCGHTLTLRVKTDAFEVFSRSKSFKKSISFADKSLAYSLLEMPVLHVRNFLFNHITSYLSLF